MINADAIVRIDSTLLPQLDRHHLRLLFHCLDSFQAMEPISGKQLPDKAVRREWCERQPVVAGDPSFVDELLRQFDAAAEQLEELAQRYNKQPLNLTLDDLIQDAEERVRS